MVKHIAVVALLSYYSVAKIKHLLICSKHFANFFIKKCATCKETAL